MRNISDGELISGTIEKREPTKEELSYIAGFFDGEGCISVEKFYDKKRGKHQYALRIEVSNTNPEPLIICKEIFGGYIGKHSNHLQKAHWKQAWRWQMSANIAQLFLEKILPYLIVKKEEARLAIIYRKMCVVGRGGGRNRLKDDQIAYREEIRNKISELKTREWVA